MKYDNDEVVHKIDGDLEYLQFKALLKYEDKIVHCFPLRHGGYSKGEFESLNLGTVSTKALKCDDIIIVRKNYNKICDSLKMNYTNLFEAHQVHGDEVEFVTLDNCGTLVDDSKRIQADGGFTNLSQIPLVSKCADCMTVLIYDIQKQFIASIHSGWKGVTKDIVTKSIDKLVSDYGCNSKDMIVCVGPYICKDCFEVKEDVKKIFENKFSYSNMIDVKDDEHYLIDLGLILKNELLNSGVLNENIHFSGICNKCHPEDFFSYRNTNGTGNTGIMGNFIMLK